MTLLDRIPRHPLFAIACGLLAVLPTVGAGWFMDDVLVRAKLLDVASPWTPAPWWDLYTFGRPDLNPGLLAAGHHPWWADPALKMTFYRPLSAATHVLDYALWPHSAALQHLHSVLWYGGAVAVVGLLLRALHGAGSRVAAIGTLAFAVATPHGLTVGWLAGRNTLIAFVIGGLVLWGHRRGRAGERRFMVAALALTVVGLFASEALLGALAYVFAYEVCLADGPWRRRRLAALAPYGLIVIGWRVLYVQAGFGSAGTAIYHDPSSDLPDFVSAVATHLPTLFGARWLPIPVELWAFAGPAGHAAFVAIGLLVALAVGLIFRRLLQTSDRARFWALGLVLALVPFTATMPMDRLVLFAGVGFAGLVGLLADSTPARPSARRARAALLVLALPLAAVFALGRGAMLGPSAAANTGGAAQAPNDAAVPDQTFVYVAGTFHRTHYTTLMRLADGAPAPRRSVVLTSMFDGAAVTRVDGDTLEVQPDRGFMAIDLDRIHRRVEAPFAVGDRVRLPDLEVEVLAITADGRPARAAFHFTRPLEDPSLRWLVVAPPPDAPPLTVETRPFDLPAIGETVRIASVL